MSAIAWIRYAAIAAPPARAVSEGRKRKATATGTRKYAARASENAPPDRNTRAVIAAMSAAVAISAKRAVTGRK